MAAPTTGPCGPWIVPEQVTECCNGLSSPTNDAAIARGIIFATAILFRLSGRIYPGECERTVRPCMGDNCGCSGQGWAQWPSGGWSFWVWDQASMGWSFPAVPFRSDGQWFNAWNGTGCCDVCELEGVTLPAPIASVTQVVINGEILDPSAYKVEGYQRVVRVDGGHFPCSQNRARESAPYGDDPNDGSRDQTWQITYTYAMGPGPDGEIAAASYACELAKFFCGAADCNLPQRVKHISREGVDMDFLDPMTFIEDGKTGHPIADMWIHSVNPSGAPRKAKISSLDPSVRRRRPPGFT